MIFAAISAFVNLSLQAGISAIYFGFGSFYFAMFFGTVWGLIVKFLLDRKWIFNDRSAGIYQGLWKFLLYSLMGVITTLEFWVVEFLFDFLFHKSWAKYIGGAIGLSIGYFAKYLLDKRYVFKSSNIYQSL